MTWPSGGACKGCDEGAGVTGSVEALGAVACKRKR